MLWPPIKHTFEIVERRVAAANSNMAEVCRRAEIQHTTWWRWKVGKAQPRRRAWNRVIETIKAIEDERAAALREALASPLTGSGAETARPQPQSDDAGSAPLAATGT